MKDTITVKHAVVTKPGPKSTWCTVISKQGDYYTVGFCPAGEQHDSFFPAHLMPAQCYWQRDQSDELVWKATTSILDEDFCVVGSVATATNWQRPVGTMA